MELLLKAGADVNIPDAKGVTALMHVSVNGYRQCAELLLNAGAIVNNPFPQRLALVSAAWNGHIKCVELLLAAGADVNKTRRFLGFNRRRQWWPGCLC